VALAHTGTQPLSAHAKRALDKQMTRMNNPSTVATLKFLNQGPLWEYVRRGGQGRAPDLEKVFVHEWGQIAEPYKAVYGQVTGETIANWWTNHRWSLFERNLRKPLPDSSVNAGMIRTLNDSPANFWYFNNGITVLCKKWDRASIGSTGREIACFKFEGAQVVNGAQTVSSIGLAAEEAPESICSARVYVRFISLEGCPEEFATEVTRATNTQNRILARDFVALDEEQERIKDELELQGLIYATKSGDADPPREQGCTVDEATIALACAKSLDLAVQAKREKGKLWEDTDRPPYTELFNRGVTGTRVWRAVQVLRVVEDVLHQEQASLEGREVLLAVHANRLVTFLVFARLLSAMLEDPNRDFAPAVGTVQELTRLVFGALRVVMSKDFANSYPTPTFKNVARCREIAARVDAFLASVQQLSAVEDGPVGSGSSTKDS
jgi:hypothetical protein